MPDRRVDTHARARIDDIALMVRRGLRTAYAGILIAFASQAIAIVWQLDKIQDSRRQVIERSCNEQNRRNATARSALDALNFPPATDVATRTLIAAVVPVQDCDRLVDRRLK